MRSFSKGHPNLTEDSEWFTHGCLDGKGSDVLPSFLQKGDQEVDSDGDILSDIIFGEIESSDSGTHAENLLELESDS